ncbi:MAG: ral secretion pathway protein [Rhodocyclaceae bacterium]|nr:ral secretion pathway protein [Rhodocyclaceae bacterium]
MTSQYRAFFLAHAGVVIATLLSGCAEPQVKPSEQHIKPAAKPAGAPPPLAAIPAVAPPKPAPRQETYSVVVNNVPAREVLFALARDARIDIDIASDIEGSITLNALNQSLPQLLDRITRQIDMRWEMEGKVLQISRDTPFLRNYKVDYVNLARQSTSSVNVATQIAGSSSAGSSGGSGGGASAGGAVGNSSLTNVTSRSDNDFWATLIANIRDLLRETDRVLPEGSYEQTQEATNSQQTTGTGAPAPAHTRGTTTPSLATSPNPAAMQTAGTTTVRRSTFREAASVIANRETGVIAVRATAKQHEKIREFMDRVLSNAGRQVLIEATIVEVSLNDQSQTGVDWKSVALASGFTFRQNLLGTALDKALPDSTRSSLISSIMGDSNLSTAQKSNLIQQVASGMGTLGDPTNSVQQLQILNAFTLPADQQAAALQQAIALPAYGGVVGTPGATVPLTDSRFTGGMFPLTNKSAGMTVGYGRGSSFAAAMSLLSQYGRTKVISSPKITALNNQSAVLRVVDNLVYFNISAQITPGVAGAAPVSVYTSTANTVAVGFVMNVIPQIDDGNQVTLTVRPTISRLRGYAQDPNPVLQNVPNLVPIVQTREMESVMKVPSGNVVMMGGLMEDSENRGQEGLPGVGDLPGVGGLFSTRNTQAGKTELVIFLRPVVINDASLEGDYSFAKDLLPGKDFFNQPVQRKIPMQPASYPPEATP